MADRRGALAPVEAVDAVAAFLEADGSVSEQSFERLVELMGRFAVFADSGCGVSDLREVSATFVRQFVEAPTSAGARPSSSTRHFRRCAVRLLFRVAREIGLAESDPTLDLRLASREAPGPRPLTDAEVTLCRSSALSDLENTRFAAAWALAEAGVRSGELARVTVDHLDLDAGLVDAPG
jgi:integrase/recombinase XerC